jgi:hypothetical protein
VLTYTLYDQLSSESVDFRLMCPLFVLINFLNTNMQSTYTNLWYHVGTESEWSVVLSRAVKRRNAGHTARFPAVFLPPYTATGRYLSRNERHLTISPFRTRGRRISASCVDWPAVGARLNSCAARRGSPRGFVFSGRSNRKGEQALSGKGVEGWLSWFGFVVTFLLCVTLGGGLY